MGLLSYILIVKKITFQKIKQMLLGRLSLVIFFLLAFLGLFFVGRLSLVIFFLLAFLGLFFASTLLLEESYKDIFIVIMIWSLPLFLH